MQTPSTPNNPVTAEKKWTVLSLLEWSTRHLQERGFDDSRLNVELLLTHTLNLSRLQLYMNFDRPLLPEELAAFKLVLQRRMKREPIQYILGSTEFMGFKFNVNPSVLIPRPETEELVELVVAQISSINSATVEVLDIGTGSGNIPISIARLSSKVRLLSIDVSEDALETAQKNIELNGVHSLTLLHADIFSEILSERKFDLIVSNPPYISIDQFENLQPEVRDFEPKIATTDGSDGYRFIRRISQFSRVRLNAPGYLFMEIAFDQADETAKIVSQDFKAVEILKDLSGNPRILKASGIR